MKTTTAILGACALAVAFALSFFQRIEDNTRALHD